MYKFQIGDQVRLCSSFYSSAFFNTNELYEVATISYNTVGLLCPNSKIIETYIPDGVMLHRSATQIRLEKRLAKIDNLLN